MSDNFDVRLQDWREQIDACIRSEIKSGVYPDEFKQILEYALFPGGKRLRPILFLEWHSLTAPPDERALKFACAIEIMHCYSLIHDDMPCMDNDDVRRGKPSVHKMYGEGKALLAGDALLNMAYGILMDISDSDNHAVLNRLIAHFGGDGGLIYGQFQDLYGDIKDIDALIDMYAKKTAALISVACLTGYLYPQYSFRYEFEDIIRIILGTGYRDGNNFTAPQDEKQIRINDAFKFGVSFGVAFQIYDDLSEYIAGEKSDGTTILDFIDLEVAKKLLNEYLNIAISSLDNFYGGDTSYLRGLAKSIIIV